jgi:hypothetical protein
MTTATVVNTRGRRLAALLTVAFMLFSAARGGDTGAGDIPVVGRPPDLPFSEASGSFTVLARAEPITVQAEQPLTFTIVVAADGPVHHPPQRIDLGQIADFNDRFYIENPDADAAPAPDARRWEFTYRLKPRRADVTEIPGVPFVFYNPAISQPNKAFQVQYTDPIPLKVQSAPVMEPVAHEVAAAFLQTYGGPALLARQAPWSPPGMVLVALLLVVPPVACAAWYVVWRRRYPDAGRQKQRRRSRAARQALARLQQAGRAPVEQRAPLTAAALADYLRERLDLAVAEPTPAEASACLLRGGCAPALVERTVAFLQTCDAARFWPPLVADGAELPALAGELILALDADTETPREPAPQGEEVAT